MPPDRAAGPAGAALRGRVALITGATSGIGRVTAGELARRGATVYAVARDRARGEEAVAAFRDAAGGADVHLLIGDLARQESVRDLAAALRARTDRLHLLIHNAGVLHRTRHVTPDGLEDTFAVNHLAPFLLTALLRDLLQAGAPARVVNVASDAHRVGRLDFEDLMGARRYRWAAAYSQSKLANILFTRELARRWAGTGVTANAVHPGGVDTRIWREFHGVFGLVLAVARRFMLRPERGAETVLHVACAPELEPVTGRYFARLRETSPSAAARDDAAAARLWEVSLALAPPSPPAAPSASAREG